MSDTKTTKMLQAIISGQSAIKEELKEEIRKNREAIQETKEHLTERIDNLGLSLAKLSDDAPTVEEFDKLEKRVSKTETHIHKN